MEANKYLEPTATIINTDRSITGQAKSLILSGLSLAKTHKFKTIFLIGAGYVTYRTYGLLKTFRDITYGNPDEPQKQSQNLTESERELRQYLQDNEHAIAQISCLKSTLETIKQILPNSTKVMAQVVQDYFKLAQVGAQFGIPNQSPSQKFEALDVIKLQLFKTLVAQVYVCRFVNVCYQVTLIQGCKLFYQLDRKKRQTESAEDIQISEQFTKDAHTEMILPFVQEFLLPMVDQVIVKQLEAFPLGSKPTQADFQKIMQSINAQLLGQLFAEKKIVTIFESFDTSQLTHHPLKQEMKSEFLDVVETDYFSSCVYSLIDESFEQMCSIVFRDVDGVMPVAKLTINLFKDQQHSGIFVEQLVQDIQVYMNFQTESEYEELLAQLIKFVYFGGLYGVKMEDLLKDPKRMKVKEEGELDLMKELMGGGGSEGSATMQGLMKMLSE